MRQERKQTMIVYLLQNTHTHENFLTNSKRDANKEWKLWSQNSPDPHTFIQFYQISGREGTEIQNRINFILNNQHLQTSPHWLQIITTQSITRTRTPEHNQKISQAMQGRSLSQSHKDNISNAMLGNQNHK